MPPIGIQQFQQIGIHEIAVFFRHIIKTGNYPTKADVDSVIIIGCPMTYSYLHHEPCFCAEWIPDDVVTLSIVFGVISTYYDINRICFNKVLDSFVRGCLDKQVPHDTIRVFSKVFMRLGAKPNSAFFKWATLFTSCEMQEIQAESTALASTLWGLLPLEVVGDCCAYVSC